MDFSIGVFIVYNLTMKELELILKPISSYFVSLTRNPMEGWYELKIGIPTKWAFSENDEIGIEIINETEVGKVLNISPKNESIVADDLVLFAQIIIDTNRKIAEKETEFKEQLEEMKRGMEKRASDYFKQLDELKENSFKKLNDNFVNGLNEAKKERKKRTPKIHIPTGITGSTT